ncbi:hypothetical protein NDA11_002506 [Ustilago hordei]|uniref:Uncharacterized protein n=1 Tax=Ustilago hordei TaxID=120017 RepID=I2FM95_USTHO|nr:hypothetical protein NDA10_000978 [Ustilago hordei]KAJ1583103.1 hypothetical protein NDA15_000571 [Ustilago hordei]KAJ1586578.1 hypothetical protein NDA11_002506 [Ustilago hordei]KAJ1592116.1 hypothetical protein NDA12_005718 [Ustilago hordei]KAJ1603206.1 hypothetical protein NDA14_004645 [Ustilago hordei]
MKVDNTNRSLADHRGKTQNAEQHLASAQHNKATGEQERHRHKEALAANTDAPVTGGPGNGAPVQTQSVTQLRNTNIPANAAQPAGYNIDFCYYRCLPACCCWRSLSATQEG